MMENSSRLILLALLTQSNPVIAQQLSMQDFLNSVDRTEVTFNGRIKYKESALNDIDFTYYNKQGEPFPVTVDAGRKTRERIEKECKNSGFMVSLKELCQIEGTGTVEIRGSRVFLSIDLMSSLHK